MVQMVKALIHTYKSRALFINLDYHLSLDNNFIDQFIIVFCRWNTYPDLGADDNIALIQSKYKDEVTNGRIKIIKHYGVYNHNEFECREMICNSYKDYHRTYLDSDDLLNGRFWWLNHMEDDVAYCLRHLIPSPTGIQEFKSVPYMFGKGVTIHYQKGHFLSLITTAKETKYLPDLYTFSISFAEGKEYKEAKKKWVSMWEEKR